MAKYYVTAMVKEGEKEKVIMIKIDGLENLIQFSSELGMGKDIKECIHDAEGEIVEELGGYDDGYKIGLNLFIDKKIAIVNID